MFPLFEPLTDEEFDELDKFLLNRGMDEPEKAFDDGQDEGILDIAELDGFLTAIVSGPQMIPPSRWLPVVWGDVEPIWESTEDFERIFSMMTRLMNGITASLMERNEPFEPIFMEREVEGKRYTIVDEWCFGYMRGFRLWGLSRQSIEEEMMELIGPINLFTKEIGWELLKNLPEDQVEGLQQEIAPAACSIHAYWLARRDEFDGPEPVVNTEPKVGRNDPCPCGSGKKYKKCCLH